WLATHHGLVHTDSLFRILKTFEESDGLANNFLYGLISDANDNIWISSNRGISQFDPLTGHAINYGMEEGLQSLEFNTGAYFKRSNGEIFLGGIAGFNYFHPGKVKKHDISAKILIDKIIVNDAPFITDTCPMAKRFLELPWSHNTVSFGFGFIDYGTPRDIHIEYILEGHDREWIDAGTNGLVRYSRLRPGNYTFRIRTGSETGTSVAAAEVTLLIRKPFWMTYPFLVFTAFITLGGIIILVRYFTTKRMKKQIARLEREQEISLIRRRISSDLHDDIGSGLSKLAMISDTALMDLPEKNETTSKLKRIASEARQMTDQLRVIVWALNPRDDQLEGLLSYIRQQTGDYLDEFKIKCSIQMPEKIPDISVSAEFKRNVYYTIREAVHNAVRHGEPRNLQIIIETEKRFLSVRVIDDGKGFDPAQPNSGGNGLRIMKQRLSDLGGEASISSRPGNGTTIEMKIPI
ncbi:MAG: ATP-binding protein, partial [Bacteroidales bacterium]|nr:ATP-binding protein [Bacteroidales bacterium]